MTEGFGHSPGDVYVNHQVVEQPPTANMFLGQRSHQFSCGFVLKLGGGHSKHVVLIVEMITLRGSKLRTNPKYILEIKITIFGVDLISNWPGRNFDSRGFLPSIALTVRHFWSKSPGPNWSRLSGLPSDPAWPVKCCWDRVFPGNLSTYSWFSYLKNDMFPELC